MITIIDYGMGNVFSVENALKALGVETLISSHGEDIARADKLILPGVGAFPDGMKNLEARGLVDILREEVLNKKKPILGICLGMQLFAGVGEEYRETKGLGWIPGRVRRFNVDEKKFRIPHIGWNDVAPRGQSRLLQGIESSVFYFVHSFHLVPEDGRIVKGVCEYGEQFAAVIEADNIFGTQFHPEKSQKSGLALLQNFLKIL